MSRPEARFLTEVELCAWARVLGRRAVEERAFVCLYGELGAGKTTVVRAACQGAGIEEPVLSPTFTLVHRYGGGAGPVVYHVDLYRIQDPSELGDTSWWEILQSEEATFVEWAERGRPHLPAERWEIRLGFGDDPGVREVEVWRVGAVAPPPSLREVASC